LDIADLNETLEEISGLWLLSRRAPNCGQCNFNSILLTKCTRAPKPAKFDYRHQKTYSLFCIFDYCYVTNNCKDCV